VASSGKDCQREKRPMYSSWPGCGLAWRVRRLFCSAGHKIQLGIKGEELEEVAMGFAGGGQARHNRFSQNHCGLARTISRLLVPREILRQARRFAGRSKITQCTRFPPERRDRRRSKRNSEWQQAGRSIRTRVKYSHLRGELLRNISTGGEIGLFIPTTRQHLQRPRQDSGRARKTD